MRIHRRHGRPRHGRRTLVAALTAVALCASPGAVAAQQERTGSGAASTEDQPGPALRTPPERLAAALSCPEEFRSDREPVLLVHGTGVDAELSWSWGYAPALRARGYDVCVVDLPGGALGDIQDSVEYVVHAVTAMRAATGRAVDVVGHSQGGLQIRWALTWWPGLRGAVDDAVALGTPERGVAAGDLVCAAARCAPALWQMRSGSAFLRALNSGDQTPGPVSYTSVYSRDDLVAAPYWTAVKEGARNIKLQDVCGIRLVTHMGLLYDALAFALVVDALGGPGPADPARLPRGACRDAYLPGVGLGEVAYATAVVAPAAAAAIATAPRVGREPALRSSVR
ncbi:esterase/lipase family protein [Streptomyces sp. NPDC057638]|uniref:esterase/lipase family protein n=1 Tax=Streptomyces sp. NPDC057638 TaxID=3346190 RepID=UPI003684E323